MSIPEHEEISQGPGKGSRIGSSAELTLRRITQIGKMMYDRRMDMVEIFTWNQEPEQIAAGWGYTYRHIHLLCKRAKMLGAALLCKDMAEAVRTDLKEWETILRKCLEIGDMRAACVAQAKISEIRGVNVGRAIQSNNPTKAVMQWKGLDKALPGVFTESESV